MHSVSLASKPIKASRFNIHRAIVDTRDFSAMACSMTNPVIPSDDENYSEIGKFHNQGVLGYAFVFSLAISLL